MVYHNLVGIIRLSMLWRRVDIQVVDIGKQTLLSIMSLYKKKSDLKVCRYL